MAVTFLRFPALFLSCAGVGSWLVSTSHRPLRLSSDFNGLSFRVGHPRTPAGQDDPQDAWAARRPMKSVPPRAGNLAVVRSYQLRKALTVKSMTTIGHVFIPLNREHDCMVPTDDDQARFERLAGSARAMGAVPTMPFQAPVGADGGAVRPRRDVLVRRRTRQCDDAVVEAEAVTAAPDLRDWLMSLAAFARRAADRHVGVVFVIS